MRSAVTALRPSALLALFLSVSFASAQSPAASPSAAPAPPHTCKIDRTSPSDGDIALAKEDYTAALAIYRAAVASSPNSVEAQLGLVRSLVGKDQVDAAIKQADETLAHFPHDALAEVAAAEAAYRAADFSSMRAHINKALQLDDCNGRALAIAARLYSVLAWFASEARLLHDAHAIRPSDELITRAWIDSLPRKQRSIELSKYLSATNALSPKDRAGYNNEQAHLQARRAGECRVTSKADSVTIPFAPMLRDATHIEAYGLDISFDGKKRRMQIDTGASGIVLAPAAAKRLGLTPEYRLHTGGVGDDGEVDSYLTHVANIQIGDVQVSDCMVEVLGKSKLDIDGLIGMDVFARWLTTLDYQNERLILSPLPPRPEEEPHPLASGSSQSSITEDDEGPRPKDAVTPVQMKDWLHIIRIGHEILLPAAVNSGQLHYMMADTGASQTILSLAFAKQSGKAHEDSEVQFVGISGKVKKTFRLDDATLQFGRLGLPRTSFYAFDLDQISHDTGVEVSGFVGLPTLSRLTITIDYRDNLMQLKYDPKRDQQRF